MHAGEIVGIAGVSGNGQQELLAALSGERTLADAGAITICGRRRRAASTPTRAARSASRSCPEERLGRGAVPEMSLAENALLTAHRQGLVARRLHPRATPCASSRATTIAAFNVKAGGPDAARAACPAATCRSSSSAARSGRRRRC